MNRKPLAAILVLLPLGAGCATSRHLITPENLGESQVEIAYVLGHSRYRFVAHARNGEAEVSSFRDDTILESRPIPLSRYREFVNKVEEAIADSQGGGDNESCRTPYRIQVTASRQERVVSGCRSTDAEGQIGQLIKEGEFLFYSDEVSEKS